MKTMGLRWEKKDECSKGRAPSKWAKTKGKITAMAYACNIFLG
jgi:hypothetical protein